MAEPDPKDRRRLDDPVPAALARLSARLAVDPAPDELVAAVQSRIGALDVPVPSPWRDRLAPVVDRLRRHWRVVTAITLAMLVGLLAVSPAGGRIAQWLGIGAVQVVPDQGGQVSATPDPANADGFIDVGMGEAANRVGFAPLLPAELGEPSRVLIGSGDRVVSMVWSGGDPRAQGSPVRLDQLAGSPDPAVIKKFADDVVFYRLDGHDAFWLRSPHPLVYTDIGGVEHTERSRIAGPTLVWQRGPVTLRLEGVADPERARQIAASVG